MSWIVPIITMMILAYAQNVSFSIVSRSRNRNHIKYHIVAAILSNGVWFATFHYLVVNDMTWMLFVPYTVATVAGSVTGQKVSMWIEQKIGATT